MKTIFDVYSNEEIDANIEEITELLNDKYSDKDILNELDCDLKEEFLSIAKAQIRNEKDKSKLIDAFYFNEEDLRFSTPKLVADYRAGRLKCNRIVDLCSGIGIQAGAFTRTCKEVLAVEIDSSKVKYAQENCKDRKNIKFLIGDVLDDDLINQVKKFSPDIIFCDPERLVEEKERNLESIKPNLRKLIEIYSKICRNICIEVPPRIDIKKLNELGNMEKEYLSLDNKLNRLDLYFGEIKKAEISVVDAVSRARLEKNSSIKNAVISKKTLSYIYEVSEAVVKAGLINEFTNECGAAIIEGCEKNKVLLTSDYAIDKKLKNLCNSYKIVGFADNFEDINKALRKIGFGKVVIKYSIEPKYYWKERNMIERGLLGKKEAAVLRVNGRYLIGEKMNGHGGS